MSASRVIDIDVGDVARPDLSTVDDLCRMALHARRLGLELRLRRVSPGLRELLDLAGVSEACGCPAEPREVAWDGTKRE